MLFGQLRQVTDAARAEVPGVRFLALTLTLKNANDEASLKAALDALIAGFTRLSKRARYKTAVLGHFRAVEITTGATGFHPHMHVLLAVDPSYFNHMGIYIQQSEWVRLWREAARLDYDPSVHIQAVRGAKALAEMTKYAAKGSNWMQSDEIVKTLAEAVKGRRLVAFGGLLRDAKARLGLEDVEAADANLVGAQEPAAPVCPVCGAIMIEVTYMYDVGMEDYRRIDPAGVG